MNILCKGQFTRQTFFSDDHDMLGKEYIEGRDLAYIFCFCLGEDNGIEGLMANMCCGLEFCELLQNWFFCNFIKKICQVIFIFFNSEISCDYSFCVFWISSHMIQQLLCFQICQSKIFNKLGNVALKFLKIGKISVLILFLFFWVESDHMVVGNIPINW